MKATSARGASPHGDATLAWRALVQAWGTADYPSAVRASRRLKALAEEPDIQRRLVPVRVAVLSSATLEFMLPVIEGALLASGLSPTLLVTPYGQVATSLLEPGGRLVDFEPQVTVALTASPHLPGFPPLAASRDEAERAVDEVCRTLIAPAVAFHERTGSEIVLDNFHPLPGRAAGNFGARLPGDATQFVRRVNLALAERAPRCVHIHDLAALAERRGIDTWFDQRYWYLAKQPVSFDCAPDYCRSLASVIGAILGRTRKCLVLDLDNTLWGGVVGDDGVAGIQIGEGSAVGEAFKAFQHYLLALKQRGVLLAVCSKNDDRIARSAFTDHPEMVLQLDDFVAFKASWGPKSEQVRAIAAELALPLEALVFVDDNPAERDEVSRALPEVAVPDLPDDPGDFLRTLDAARLFEVAALTPEDVQRTATYQARRQSIAAVTGTIDLAAHLASLEMAAIVRPFEPVAFERITQLVNKTNQFNLTTRRVVLAEVQRLATDPASLTRTVRLRDRFGDHGLISVLYGRLLGGELLIDAWLMSCRVLGRGVERVLLNDLLTTARECGIQTVVGYFTATDRNALVAGHYASLGFTRDPGRDGTGPPGAEAWRLTVAGAVPLDTSIATIG